MAKASLNLNLKIDENQFKSAIVNLANIKDGARRAAVSALNKTVKGIRTDMVKEVTRVYTVKSKIARDSMKIDMANKNKLSASVNSRGSVLPMTSFRHSITSKMSTDRHIINIPGVGFRLVRQKKYTIKVAILKGNMKTLKSAFMMQNKKTNQLNVAWRENDDRDSARPRYAPSVPVMIQQQKVLPDIEKMANKRLYDNMKHEIERIAKGYGK